ncbi:MAG: hypothetical protein NVS3B14_02100 [Ktedonobacteraceae bacterium]
MIELLVVGGMISFLTALIGVLLALRIQYRIIAEKQIEREAWENAQARQIWTWEATQKKHTKEFEQQLAGQVGLIQKEWQECEARKSDHSRKLSLEYTINALPKVEETPLSLDGHHHFFQAPANWRTSAFYQADLRGRDFSHRYLRQADLRAAQLAGANFYMADLRNASLAGANLAGASLIGANLTDADLRGANLVGANLLVADLRDAVLYGANLLNARNLTMQQIYEASYDHTTQLDSEIDITMTRIPVAPSKTTDQTIGEAPLLSPLSSDDSQQASELAGLPTHRSENTLAGVFSSNTPAKLKRLNRSRAG